MTTTTDKVILPQHLRDLADSGLETWQIEEAGLYSETDPATLAKILGWNKPIANRGAALVFPFRKLCTGEINGFARLKFDKPRTDAKGGLVKYEQPKGQSLRPYFPNGSMAAIRQPGVMVGFVEGEKKALAGDQSGFPTIGLTGVFAWQAKREGQCRRQLIPELQEIDWQGRIVWIAFDRDPCRNPNVNHARAELARVLTDEGAKVHLIDLPHGPTGEDGMPGKMGLDDFLLRHGWQAFRSLLFRLIRGSQCRDINDYRREMARARRSSLGVPGVYLDRSPTGSGKSYADIAAITEVRKSLTVLPSHANCEETETDYLSHRLDAAAYPAMTKETCENHTVAEQALNWGLSVSEAICPTCKFRDACNYRMAMQDAENAAHRIATHARAKMGFARLAKEATYVAIHEDAIDLLKPTAELSAGLESVAEIARHARAKIEEHDGFGCRA